MELKRARAKFPARIFLFTTAAAMIAALTRALNEGLLEEKLKTYTWSARALPTNIVMWAAALLAHGAARALDYT